MSGDYGDFLFYDEEMLAALRPQAEEFINVIELLLISKSVISNR